MYEKLYPRRTVNGVSIDKCIQPSVDNTGRIIGIVAGDAESYEVGGNQHPKSLSLFIVANTYSRTSLNVLSGM